MDELQVKEYLTQGAVMESQGKYEEAIKYYEKAERENPMEIEIYISKGVAYANLDKLDEARGQFEKALKVNRAAGVVYYHLGSIEILQNNIALGFENYNKAISNGFDDAQVYYSIALLHEENGDFETALRNYSKAIMRDALRPDIRIRKVLVLIKLGQTPEALQALDETILSNPDVSEGYHLKFSILLDMHRFKEAEEVLNHAMEMFPGNIDFVLDKVTLLIELKKNDEASTLLNEVERIGNLTDSALRNIYLVRARIHTMCEDVNSAISELNKADVLTRKNGTPDSEVLFLMSHCYLAAEDFEKLLECSREIINNSENEYFTNAARYYEPLALKRLGRMDEAFPIFQEAISEFRNQALATPGNLDAYLLRCLCLKDSNQCDHALELIDYVITLTPENPEPRMIRAAILEELGRLDEAKTETKIANTMLPEELRVS
ncbi:MAG: tetratricopeptide repeat protein [Oscillospiraceae bacterium]|nr:tetratricopeptide repeat protein [Oscillospiraceae bacterium]